MPTDDVCSGQKGCGARIRRLITEGGMIRDLEPIPHPAGNHTIITTPAGLVRAHVVTGTEYTEQPTYRVHKCPPKPTPGPACAVCFLPMDRDLAERERWVTHPCCDPAEGARRVRKAAPRRSGRTSHGGR